MKKGYLRVGISGEVREPIFRYSINSCDDWKAIWKINGNIWKVALHTKKIDGDSYSYDYLEVSRNVVLLELTKGFGGNGSISGRKYNLEDLELMLGVEIEIDQTNMAAYMN